nr:MAG TPA: hypothetical protein [Caudoviricetes sp.]
MRVSFFMRVFHNPNWGRLKNIEKTRKISIKPLTT